MKFQKVYFKKIFFLLFFIIFTLIGFYKKNQLGYNLFSIIFITMVISFFLSVINNSKLKILRFIDIFNFNIIFIYICIFILEISLFLKNNYDLYNKKKLPSEEFQEKVLNLNPDYSFKSKYEYIEDLKKKGIDAYPALISYTLLDNNLDFLPLSGKSNVLTVLCNEAGYMATYTSDKYGLRNNNDIYKSDIDFAIVGDSFIHGQCVDEGFSISEYLNKKTLNVLSLGISGAGPYTQYALIREYVEQNKIKKVYWFFSLDNDLDQLYEKNNLFLRSYLDNIDFNQNLIYKQNLIDANIDNIIQNDLKNYKSTNNFLLYLYLRFKDKSFLNFLILSDFRNTIKISLKKRKIKDTQNNLYEYEKFIETVKKQLDEKNIEIKILFFPTFDNISNKVKPKYYDDLINIYKRHNIEYIDTLNYILNQNYSSSDLFPFDICCLHYSESGYEIFSHLIEKDYLSEKNN